MTAGAGQDGSTENVAAIRACLHSPDPNQLQRCVDELHPSDLAAAACALSDEERLELFRLVPPSAAGHALAEMAPEWRPESILASLPVEQGAAALASIADDDATDLLGATPPGPRRSLLGALPEERAELLRRLLAYPEDSAGGIMTTGLVSLPGSLSVSEAIQEVRRQGRGLDEDFQVLFVVDDGRRLIGTMSLRHLVLAAEDDRVAELHEPPPATVPPEMDQEEVARTLHRYDLPSIAVVTDDRRLLGRVTWDDVLDVLEEEQTEDILRLSGAPPEEEVRGGWGSAVRSRLPWLFLNLGTAGLAAAVVLYFQGTIDQLVILAAIMPIIAALGGNAGTQALAVTIRRIALESGPAPGRWRVAGKELLVGIVNGAALGLTVGAIGLLWKGDAIFGLVVLIAMWGNLVVASFAGAFVPILLDRMGADPAVASSVFVTTFTDMAGFILLLGLATAVLL